MHTESNEKTRLAYRAVSIAFMTLDKTQSKIAECQARLKSATSDEHRRELNHQHQTLQAEWQKDYAAYVEANRTYLRVTGHPQ